MNKPLNDRIGLILRDKDGKIRQEIKEALVEGKTVLVVGKKKSPSADCPRPAFS